MKLKKTYLFLLNFLAATAIACIFFWYGIMSAPLPWKKTDASDPHFEVSNFKFTDYYNDTDLYKTLNILLPKGMSKKDVDNILVSIGKAEIKLYAEKDPSIKVTDKRYYYEYRSIRSIICEHFAIVPKGEFTSKVTIVFDSKENLLTLNVI